MLLTQLQAIFSGPLQHTYNGDDENSVWCIQVRNMLPRKADDRRQERDFG